MPSVRAAAAVVAILGAALTVASCGSSAALRTDDVEQQIATDLSAQVGGEFEVTCPSPVPAEAGYAFTCTVADRTTGASLSVSVVEADADGTFSWRVEATP